MNSASVWTGNTLSWQWSPRVTHDGTACPGTDRDGIVNYTSECVAKLQQTGQPVYVLDTKTGIQ